MNFVEAVRRESNLTRTENNAVALRSSNNSCVDLFSMIGALRDDPKRAVELFEEAYSENPLLATKILFYGRDIREGLGERMIFRTILRHCANKHPEAVLPNIHLIGEYGRFDDMYCLIGTPVENAMWNVMKLQLKEDIDNCEADLPISLLAKWIKTPDASSKNTRALGILTAKKLGYSVRVFKRILRVLRNYSNVVESKMSTNNWNKIKYEGVPSRAMMIYRNAFAEHDGKRFSAYIEDVIAGKSTINSSALYPYDITEKLLRNVYSWAWVESISEKEMEVLEAQWRSLPDYAGDKNILVMADVSGSMDGRPMASSIGLAMYFAERNKGAFHNLFMTFSENPKIESVTGNSLLSKVRNLYKAGWGFNTNLEGAFDEILNLAIQTNATQEEMPESLVIVTDMEFDEARSGGDNLTFLEAMEKKYRKNGYQLPNIVFWNVRSAQNICHAEANHPNIQLVSGHSVNTFKSLIQCLNMTPVEAMLKTIETSRYAPIAILKD